MMRKVTPSKSHVINAITLARSFSPMPSAAAIARKKYTTVDVSRGERGGNERQSFMSLGRSGPFSRQVRLREMEQDTRVKRRPPSSARLVPLCVRERCETSVGIDSF